MYFVVGRSPTKSNFKALYMFMHKISTRVVCLNGEISLKYFLAYSEIIRKEQTWLLTSIKGLYLYSLFVNLHNFNLSI